MKTARYALYRAPRPNKEDHKFLNLMAAYEVQMN